MIFGGTCLMIRLLILKEDVGYSDRYFSDKIYSCNYLGLNIEAIFDDECRLYQSIVDRDVLDRVWYTGTPEAFKWGAYD